MNDTHPKIEKKMREMIQNKSPEERLKLGCSMFDFALTLVIHSIEHEKYFSPGKLKREVFLRFYGNDFNDQVKNKILSYLSNTPPT